MPTECAERVNQLLPFCDLACFIFWGNRCVSQFFFQTLLASQVATSNWNLEEGWIVCEVIHSKV